MNISPRQLHHVDLLRHVVEALGDAGLSASRLEIEITESSAMQNPEATIQTLNALKALGIRVSIDDFGMGYSSLSLLQRLPIDTLKIDRSFVRDISTDPGDAAIATAIITLAHSLKLNVVAEGVETQRAARVPRPARVRSRAGVPAEPAGGAGRPAGGVVRPRPDALAPAHLRA